MHSETLWHSYLFAFIFWWGLSMGCLGFVLLHSALKARWGLSVLRIAEAGAKTLPVVLLLFIPILVGMKDLYSWADPAVVAADKILQHKSAYLNPMFFTVRAAVYFAIWAGLVYFLTGSSLRQDRTGDPDEVQKRANVAAPGLVLFVLSVNFAATDWVMSLDPHWLSTIYGVLFVVGQGLAATAFMALIATSQALRGRAPYAEVVTPRVTRDIGNLMLALTMLWAYMSLSQYLIIWSANLPEEITYYLARTQSGWLYTGAFLIVFHFFVPFLALLSGLTKRTARLLMLVSILVLVMRAVDVFWVVVPAFRADHFGIKPMDVVWFLGMGAVWLASFFALWQRAPLLPNHEPIPQEALEHA